MHVPPEIINYISHYINDLNDFDNFMSINKNIYMMYKNNEIRTHIILKAVGFIKNDKYFIGVNNIKNINKYKYIKVYYYYDKYIIFVDIYNIDNIIINIDNIKIFKTNINNVYKNLKCVNISFKNIIVLDDNLMLSNISTEKKYYISNNIYVTSEDISETIKKLLYFDRHNIFNNGIFLKNEYFDSIDTLEFSVKNINTDLEYYVIPKNNRVSISLHNTKTPDIYEKLKKKLNSDFSIFGDNILLSLLKRSIIPDKYIQIFTYPGVLKNFMLDDYYIICHRLTNLNMLRKTRYNTSALYFNNGVYYYSPMFANMVINGGMCQCKSIKNINRLKMLIKHGFSFNVNRKDMMTIKKSMKNKCIYINDKELFYVHRSSDGYYQIKLK